MGFRFETEEVEEVQDDIQGQEGQEQDGQETPEQSRDSIYAEAEAEGTENVLLDSLAGKENITLEDLRQIPGTENLTDAQLAAEWARANKGKTAEPEKIDLPFPVYDNQGNKVTADKVTLAALFKGDLQIGYNAMGKEQRKAIADVIRNASQGHWNEHRYTTVQGQLTNALKELTDFKSQVGSFTEREAQWNAALMALIAGDKGPMQKIVDNYQQQVTSTGVVPKGFVSQESIQQEQENQQAGMRWMQETGWPAAYDIATRYSAQPKEVMGAIEYFLKNEPMLTPQRIQEIIDYDVPMAFEQRGYSAKAPISQAQPANEVAELRKTIEALQSRIASTANASTDKARQKAKTIPPAGSGSVGGAGDSMPSFKSRAQFKAWSQGDPDWAKA